MFESTCSTETKLLICAGVDRCTRYNRKFLRSDWPQIVQDIRRATNRVRIGCGFALCNRAGYSSWSSECQGKDLQFFCTWANRVKSKSAARRIISALTGSQEEPKESSDLRLRRLSPYHTRLYTENPRTERYKLVLYILGGLYLTTFLAQLSFIIYK